jgi:hypothetical protein
VDDSRPHPLHPHLLQLLVRHALHYPHAISVSING